ncbi:acetyltransferase [Ruegeria marisrubri]|uniref:Acetyltransferase n=1 Tax=Ruegeria marisrubri TaxID=1685379 RepID=A0A0X3U891_9RHOB|nr:GNAT family N-acetyltransferase [Ruegeria marisrubri]KUJ84079.1 acetyltransferase [Ruegeria marisrubri]
MNINHESTDTKGRYSFAADGGPEAEMTYSKAGDHMIIIDHTGVPDAYRGQGIGLALVERAITDARSAGKKVLPLCPYAAAQFKRHPEWADVLSS